MISFFMFSGVFVLCGFIFVMAGLAGGNSKSEVLEICFISSIFIALISYGFMLVNFIKQFIVHKWKALIFSEKLNLIALLIMFIPVLNAISDLKYLSIFK